MKILIVDNNSIYLDCLKKLFIQHDLVIQNPSELDESESNKHDLIVLSGGHGMSVYGNEEYFKNEINLVKTSTAPIIGICLGMEIILVAYNQNLQNNKVNIKGEDLLKISEEYKIFEGLDPTKLSIYENHKWYVGSVTEDLHVLARCKHCIQIVKASNKNIYGLQFHPEVLIENSEESKIIDNILFQISSIK